MSGQVISLPLNGKPNYRRRRKINDLMSGQLISLPP
jgi:hypothetical protein